MESALSAREIYSVSRLNREVRVLLERGFGSLWLEAEISNFARPSSGHWYFSLKDATAQVRCCMFRQRNMLAHIHRQGRPKGAGPGPHRPVRAARRIPADHRPHRGCGLGALKRQFELLSAKLSAEGLFAAERKRPLPTLPKRIGVITSPTGAAIRDILHVLARRFASVPVLIYPVAVQGSAAAGEITAALQLAGRRGECDVLILARGGGSLEDLWAFNDEALARAIVASPIPVISGVGHEIDFTIADFCRRRARTDALRGGRDWWCRTARNGCSPCSAITCACCAASAATWRFNANGCAGSWAGLHWSVPRPVWRSNRNGWTNWKPRLSRTLRHGLAERRSTLGDCRTRLWQASPVTRVQRAIARHAALAARLRVAGPEQLRRSRERLLPLVRTLNAVSPLATLERGYAIVSREDGSIVQKRRRRCRRFHHRSAAGARQDPRPGGTFLVIRTVRALLYAAVLAPAFASSFSLPHESAVPGGVKLIRLDGSSAAEPDRRRRRSPASWWFVMASPGWPSSAFP